MVSVKNDNISPDDYLKAWQKRRDNACMPYAKLLGKHALQLGVIDVVGKDTNTIVGLVRHLRMQLEIPGELERIKALGAAETDWYQPLPPPPASEKLTLILEEEPGPALAACLARDGFIRVTTETEARPIVAMGRGNYKDYWALLEGTDRVVRGGPPGGILRGTPFNLVGSNECGSRGPEALLSSSGVESAPPPSAPAPEDPSPERPAEAAPVHGLLGARPYRVAEIERADDGLPLHKLPRERWKSIAAEVARQEGPADANRIATRAGELFGQICVRGQTVAKFEACLIEHTKGSDPLLVQTEGRFYYAAGRPVRARDRSGSDARLRVVGNLPVIEIRAALTEALEAGRPLPRPDLIPAAARLLGYDLKVSGSRKVLAARIATEIDGLVGDGDVVELEGLLALPAAPAMAVPEKAWASAGPSADAPSDEGLSEKSEKPAAEPPLEDGCAPHGVGRAGSGELPHAQA